MLTIGSLFSGIGGLELGLEACGLGPVLWQAEIDPFCRAVLAKHWPEARRYEDVRSIDATADHPDVICGGFPCQDLSLAGKQRGLSADRSGLWWEFRRIVRVLRPRFVVVENVHGAWRKWLPVVRRGLWNVGYASMSIRVRASDVGAPHERARVFVVAHAHCESVWEQRRGGAARPGAAVAGNDGEARDASSAANAKGERLKACRAQQLPGFASVGGVNGDVRTAADANGSVSVGRCDWFGQPASVETDGEPRPNPDPDRAWQLQPQRRLSDQWGRAHDGDGWDPEPTLCRGDHGVRPGMDRRTAARARATRRYDRDQRAAREKALGNAVVPQAAREAWLTAMELTGWAP